MNISRKQDKTAHFIKYEAMFPPENLLSLLVGALRRSFIQRLVMFLSSKMFKFDRKLENIT